MTKLLSAAEVAQRLDISYTHFMGKVKTQSHFPKGFRATPKSHEKWREEQIEAFIQAQEGQ